MPLVLVLTAHFGDWTVDVRRPTYRLYWFLQHILGAGRETREDRATTDMPFVLVFTAHPALVWRKHRCGRRFVHLATGFTPKIEDVP